jgi:3-oxoadipate enol-lactonase
MVSHFEAQFRAAREARQADQKLLRGYNNQVNAVLNHDTFDRLPQITAPTLVFAGRYDGGNPPGVTRAMANQIPGARYELLESGHGNWFFNSTAWETIIGFLHGDS